MWGADRVAWRPHAAKCLYMCLQPVRRIRTKKTADFVVESRNPTANLFRRQKFRIFFTCRRMELKLWDFQRFGMGILSLGYTAYTEHQICRQL